MSFSDPSKFSHPRKKIIALSVTDRHPEIDASPWKAAGRYHCKNKKIDLPFARQSRRVRRGMRSLSRFKNTVISS
jgi:chloramphenicol O-acetyltransferase